MSVKAPERIWIESEGGCPYFYHEEELSDVDFPITEYVRADKLEELTTQLLALRKWRQEYVGKLTIVEASLTDLKAENERLRQMLQAEIRK